MVCTCTSAGHLVGLATGGMGALPAAGIVALAILGDTSAMSVGSIQGAARQ